MGKQSSVIFYLTLTIISVFIWNHFDYLTTGRYEYTSKISKINEMKKYGYIGVYRAAEDAANLITFLPLYFVNKITKLRFLKLI